MENEIDDELDYLDKKALEYQKFLKEKAIKLELNGSASSSQKTRHIDIRQFFVHDRIQTENINIWYCPTHDMLADFFSKPLQGSLFNKFRRVIMGYEHISVLHLPTLDSLKERVGLQNVTEPNDQPMESYLAVAKRATAPKTEPKAEPAIKAVPIQFQAGSGYFKDKSQQPSNEFFALIDPNKPLSVEVRARGGAHYDPGKKVVVIGSADRRAKSEWFAEKILYHEYGHAIDWQRNLRYSPEVKRIMDNARTSLRTREMYTRRVSEYSYTDGKYKTVTKTEGMMKIAIISDKLSKISYRIMRMPESVFTKRGLTKADAMEAFNSTADAVMSLNSSYGWGHTKSYFSRPGMKEAEFLAHAFENAFGGNPVFKKYLPEIYDETVKYIKSLK
jgi:hypothetical protein